MFYLPNLPDPPPANRRFVNLQFKFIGKQSFKSVGFHGRKRVAKKKENENESLPVPIVG